jgi:hypothetical protein
MLSVTAGQMKANEGQPLGMWLPALCTGEWISLYSKGMSLPSG